MGFFKQGYNCAQSVVAAFREDLGVDLETALKLASSFGGGMGKLREVCGAVSGMFIVAGFKYGYNAPEDRAAKAAHYQLIKELGTQFKEENRSIVCRELLGLGPDGKKVASPFGMETYKKRPCVELVGCAASIMEEYIKNNQE